MNLFVNGDSTSLESSNATIADLLTINKVASPDMVSVHVNGEFVSHDSFGTTWLKDGDAIDFLYFMGGGQ